MCHMLTFDVHAKIQLKKGWLIGRKEIKTLEDGRYMAPAVGRVYSHVQLDWGILIHDKSFEPQPIMVVCAIAKPAEEALQGEGAIVLYGSCPAGLHAFYDYKDAPKGWAAAARIEWLSFASDKAFSAHTLLCAKNNRQLRKLIKEYEQKKKKIWNFTWRFSPDKSQPKSPVFGQGDSTEEAVNAALANLQKHRPLHHSERKLVLEALNKQTTPNANQYAEIHSPLWI